MRISETINDHDISVKRADNGWWHIRGQGPCNWAQPPHWPCSEATLREHAFPEASEGFIRSALRAG
jgi:hypothetical protein